MSMAPPLTPPPWQRYLQVRSRGNRHLCPGGMEFNLEVRVTKLWNLTHRKWPYKAGSNGIRWAWDTMRPATSLIAFSRLADTGALPSPLASRPGLVSSYLEWLAGYLLPPPPTPPALTLTNVHFFLFLFFFPPRGFFFSEDETKSRFDLFIRTDLYLHSSAL